MILHKYYDISFLLEMDLFTVNELFIEALEKEHEDIIQATWHELYPFMLSGFIEFVEYDDFKSQVGSKKVSSLSDDEIREEFADIIAHDRQVR